MKKILPSLFILTSFLFSKGYSQCIPDANFRDAITNFNGCPTCLDINGCLTADAQNVTELLLNGQEIADITGVEGFTNLESLICTNNLLTFVPPLPDSLKKFYCSDNFITSISSAVLPPYLQELKCDDNLLSQLPVMPNSLNLLFCSGNNLTSLPVLPQSLENLTCNDNFLTQLPPLPSALTSLHCINNQITSLPELPEMLEKLYCAQNPITALPELPATLNVLDISYTTISCLPELPYDITFFDFSNSLITCLPNLPAIFSTVSPLPLCQNVTGDSCALNPKVTGTVFVDYDGDAFQDVSDIGFPAMDVTANSGNWESYTNADGYYELNTGFSNTYTINVVPPPLNYSVTSPVYILTFNNNTNQVVNNINFAVHPDPNAYDLAVELTPGSPTPGGQMNYFLTYTNRGPFPINNGSVQFQYDDNLTYINANLAPTSTNATLHTCTWIFTAPLLPFSSKTITITFDVPSTILLGTELNFSAFGSIIGETDVNPSNNSIVDSVAVQASSLNLNYKVVNITSIHPDNVNNVFLEYTIYFQNNGTTIAQNLDVYDSLSNNLAASGFQIVGSSHPYTFELSNNVKDPAHPLILHWKFTGINLPPSLGDPLASCGFVKFIAKVQDGLPEGSKILNSAFLQFNNSTSSIHTNTVTTAIQYPVSATNPDEDVSNILIYPNPFDDHFMLHYKLNQPENVEIKIYNTLGAVIWSQSVSGAIEMNLPVYLDEVPAGPYLLRITGMNVNVSGKILKL